MIHLTWKFIFRVFERCSFLIWLLILLVLCIYFIWKNTFCGQNLSNRMLYPMSELRNSGFSFSFFHFPSCMTPKFNIKVFNFHFYSKVSELQKMSYEVIICLTQFYNVIIHNFTRFSKSAIPDFLKMSTVSTLCWFKNVRGWNIPILLNIAFISNEHIIIT